MNNECGHDFGQNKPELPPQPEGSSLTIDMCRVGDEVLIVTKNDRFSGRKMEIQAVFPGSNRQLTCNWLCFSLDEIRNLSAEARFKAEQEAKSKRPAKFTELSETPKLADCPFCGEAPEYRERAQGPKEHGPGSYWPEHVQCTKCRILFRTGENGVVDAISHWNKRIAK